ncbi:MAG: YfiR family protein, partial [Acidobacteria bacterium]|nr:YfiR family protein [Acidobacteriota bacterium]
VGAAASDYAGTVARAAAPRGALTVSEIDIAEAPDTVVNLAVEDGRVVFDVNRDVAERSGLQLGARLLKAARAVYGRGRGQP